MPKSAQSNISTPSFSLGLVENLRSLRPDLKPSDIAALVIDETSYYRDHKDVQKAGVPAARHYFQYGEKEKRKYCYPRLSYTSSMASQPVQKGKTIFYTTAPEDNPSWLYRCVFPNKNHENSDDHIFFSGANLLSDLLIGIFAAKKIIFLRPGYNPRTIYLIQLARMLGISIEFDFDDLLLPEFARERGACRSGLRSPQEDFSESLKQSALTVYADSITCSTDGIAVELSKITPNVTVRRNKLPLHYFRSVENIVSRGKSYSFPDGKVKILYLSGSNTHKRDFSTITGPLTKLAQQYGDKFTISFMGSLSDYSNVFNMLGVKSQMIPSVAFDKMLDIISMHDLVLVPLEDSIFNNCKSNIKYIECASQGVPIIASSVSEFDFAIKNGVNGWLCNDEADWYQKLVSILLDPDSIISCGINAYSHAKKGLSV